MRKTLLAFTLLLTSTFTAATSASTTLADNHSQVTAHRGSSASAPENTLRSIRQAIEDGAGYAEIDVQETADGVIVLMHDDNAQRTTGLNKPMWQVTYAELMKASAGAWFNKKFADERVPTLDEVITAAEGKIKLNIELKNNGHQVRLAEETVAILERRHFEKECTITSFDRGLLGTVKERNKKIKTGLIVGSRPDNLAKLMNDKGYEVISIAYPHVNRTFMREAAKANKEVYAWTVNDRQAMNRMLDLGVSSVITNHPDRLVEVMNKRPHRNNP